MRDAETWIERSLATARARAEKDLAGPERELALTAVDELARPEPSGAIARLSEERWHRVLVALGSGDRDEAMRRWLDPELTYQERRLASRRATADELDATDQRKRDLETFLDTLAEIGKKAVRIVVPILLAALAA